MFKFTLAFVLAVGWFVIGSPPASSTVEAALFRRPARHTWHARPVPAPSARGYPAPRTYHGRTYYWGAPGYTGPGPRPGGPVWARYLNEPFYMHPERKVLGILP